MTDGKDPGHGNYHSNTVETEIDNDYELFCIRKELEGLTEAYHLLVKALNKNNERLYDYTEVIGIWLNQLSLQG